MDQHRDTHAVVVPSPVERDLFGIVERDGRFHWSGAAMFCRTAGTLFVCTFLVRLVHLGQSWRAEPEWLGVPGLSWAVAGVAAVSGLGFAAVVVLATSRHRRRFNQAAPPVPGDPE